MRSQTNASTAFKWFIAAIFFAMFLSACSSPTEETSSGRGSGQPVAGKSKPADQSPAKAEVVIKIENFVYEPAEVTIEPGTRVTWINNDEAPHTVTGTEEEFNSGALDTGDKFSYVFSEKGEFPYYCALHPHMRARITVK